MFPFSDGGRDAVAKAAIELGRSSESLLESRPGLDRLK